jgi:HK97 family phage major capsid protein
MILSFAEALDLAALNGSGASGQPIGVFGTTGVGTSTLTDPTTYNELLAFISTVRGNNGLKGSLGWAVSNADMIEIEQMIDTDSGGTNTRSQVHERRRLLSETGDRMLGYPVKVSTQLTDGKVAFGNWNDLVIAQWGGMALATTNAVGFLTGQAHVRMISLFDIGIRQPKSFCIPA